LNEQEKQYLIQQLEVCGGKISLAARNCGVDVKTLYRKMRQHSLDKRFFRRQGNADVLVNKELLLNGRTPGPGHSQDLQS
jgi:hypothetical protein